MQCEGFRRYGGAFTLGPVTWQQCKEEATVELEVKQDGEVKKFPACVRCWRECIDNKIEIISVEPYL